MRTVACVSIGGVSLKSLINHSLDGFWSHVVWVGVVRRVLATRSACRPSLVSCLSSLGESVPYAPNAYVVAVPDVPGYGSRVHTHDHGGSEAPDGSPDSILSSEPKPLGKHRPPPPQSILSPGESSYPP
ncbi:hypothetical protein Tco_0754968 [Tanacetum coccineum]